ncbi:MAG: hypothetical protein AAF226_17245 [Verrucomicrobiota bacterium]
MGKEIDEDQVGSPLFYLRRALQPTASLKPTVSAASFTDAAGEIDRAKVIIVDGECPVDLAEAIHRSVAADGKLAVVLTSRATSEESLQALMGLDSVKVAEIAGRDYSMLSDLNFDHPILAPFSRAGIRDFTKVKFWKGRRLELESEAANVIARFDDGEPAWVVQSVGEEGKGQVFVSASGWSPSESQFPLSSKFVPVVYSILENAGYSARQAPTIYVGETEHGRPGLHPVPGGDQLVAVNLHPSEGGTTSIDPAVILSDFGISTQSGEGEEEPKNEQEQAQLLAEEKESQQKLWKWLLVAVLIFVLAETWLAGRSSVKLARA